MKTAVHFLLVLGSLLHVTIRAQELSSDVTELALKNADFAMSLYREIASASDDNVFFSPLCVSSALAALSTGAQGATREKILQGLGVAPLEQDGQPERIPDLFHKLQEAVTKNEALQFDQAAALFVRQQLEVETAFSDLIKKYFGADVNKVDFANAQASKTAINEYVKSKTGGKVMEVVGTVDPQTALMLISSVFFQGNWALPFSTSSSPEERFFINKYKIIQVPMMFNSDKYYLAYDPTVKMGALKLPYQGGVAMLVLLPDKDVDYTSVDEVLTGERFLGWIKRLKKTKLEVQLPRFSLEQSYALKAVLSDLGIYNVSESADLSGVSKEPNLSLSEMIHKAKIEVKESGTATAETDLNTLSAPPRLIFNRPFLFVIYHEATNSPLFMGRVIDPTKK
ncbi:serpin peptidase inhibitor, clade A (alpha-1 antiproteinase, antitrypsin), member 10a [Anguilla anguilla]|uniref:serpin peptidase inhibitor, clade A (alpha-1 antiproteinase, antitrypsin), member 10a n=1 Tax=Anguilla anguilla TaxID=7936 RepID=UPI0015B0D4CB|nr:serpin peptidase inhibitor, clade A (alpha-1 antiproteinase, antitrypsin), member 10a [Anguilla anguilla]XP_035276211.1 serpin peptidase inhibitor, clade A (alpha-1 antiproteinase, antitrypsin), member 10a [Anguilla anguilla]